MQVIYCKTLKTFALLNLFFLFLAVKKRNKKTPGCIVDFFHCFFRSLIFARLRCAKIYTKRKKVEPAINNARPDLRFDPNMATKNLDANSGECFFS
jgi:multisubunit Na+/H+ antiporter MnhE subunit